MQRERSAFAAAFFSLVFPGLGQAYLGRWKRALAWAAAPIIGSVLLAVALVVPSVRERLEAWLLTPSILQGVVVLLVVDLLYRLACVVDAWRLAQADPDPASGRTAASFGGLVAVVLVLVTSHVAVARAVLIVHDALVEITAGVIDEPVDSPPPGGGPSARPPTTTPAISPTAAPTGPLTAGPATPAASAGPVASPEPAWVDGGTLDILLVGADSGRSGYDNYLTDTMILVRIDPDTKQAAFISLPRDTQDLPIPRDWPAYEAYGGVYPGKANTIYTQAAWYRPDLFPGDARNKGFNALKGMLGELFGVTIDYFVGVDLQSFRDVIDDLGGVVIDVQSPVSDDHYPAADGDGHSKLYLPPGMQFMNGQQALAYARARHVTSDFDRSFRQQRVITSVREQLDLSTLLSPGTLQRLLATARSSIRTDFPPDQLPRLLGLAQEIDLDKRISLGLNPPTYSETCFPCPPDGLYALKANVPRIREAVATVFTADTAARERAELLESEGATVEVRNGTPSNNLKTTRLAAYLASLGVNAAVPDDGGAADRNDYPSTVVTVYNGASDQLPVSIRVIEEALGVTAVTADDPGQIADIVVIVGADTPSLAP